MCKFDTDEAYDCQLVFPSTLLGLARDVCRQAGVELGNADFRNANIPILANPFINGENCRTVLKSIAKLAFSCAYIGQDNKLYIGFDISGIEWETAIGTDEVEIEVEEEQYANNYIIEGNSYQDHTPTTENPSNIIGVGDLVSTGTHAGEYLINIVNDEESYDIYIDSPLYKVEDITDYIDFASGELHRNLGKIDSYNGEEIITPYISSTGELSTGATVIYVLDSTLWDYIITEDNSYLITESSEYVIGE